MKGGEGERVGLLGGAPDRLIWKPEGEKTTLVSFTHLRKTPENKRLPRIYRNHRNHRNWPRTQTASARRRTNDDQTDQRPASRNIVRNILILVRRLRPFISSWLVVAGATRNKWRQRQKEDEMMEKKELTVAPTVSVCSLAAVRQKIKEKFRDYSTVSPLLAGLVHIYPRGLRSDKISREKSQFTKFRQKQEITFHPLTKEVN